MNVQPNRTKVYITFLELLVNLLLRLLSPSFHIRLSFITFPVLHPKLKLGPRSFSLLQTPRSDPSP